MRQIPICLMVVGLLLPGAAVALTPEEKCEANKLETAGKYAFCRMKAESKAVKNTTVPDYTKCDESYGAKWAKIESKAAGTCPMTGDATPIKAQTTGCTDSLTAAIGGDDRFTDNGDGTITDNKSGLMWEKKTELDGNVNFANPHDADNLHRWSGTCTVLTSKFCQPTTAAAALCSATVEGDPTGCAECVGGDGVCDTTDTIWAVVAARNAGSLAGHSDWRVPTRQELETILDLADTTPPTVDVAFQGPSCGAVCTDITDGDCSCTQSYDYWSASTFGPNPDIGWVVDFLVGDVNASGKTNNDYVRAVRGGS